MKKYILPVVLLALLSGCGKVKDVSEVSSQIEIVSGTAAATTSETSSTEAETTTDDDDKKTTTTKKAGDKVSGTTTSVKSTGRVVTRASGGSVVHGTTRVVPTAPRTTSKTTTSSTSTQQPTTQPATYDPKDYSSITFELKDDKLEVIRPYSDGKSRSPQTLTVDTSEIKEKLEESPSKTINDFIESVDYDFDGYPDLFVAEKSDDLNKTGKYFRYDPEKGAYVSWSELNSLKFETKIQESTNRLKVLENINGVDWNQKFYEWNSQNQLVLREYIHQYTVDGDIIVETITYDENGFQLSRTVEHDNGEPYEEGTTTPIEEE
jgi:hypothetical protein